MKASPGRGKLSPQVTDEGAGQQHFALNTPHPALRATCSPFCRCATFSPGAGEICPQGVKALALGQAEKVDSHEVNVPSVVFSTFLCYPVEKDVSRMQFPSATPSVKKQKSKARRLCSFA